MSARGEVVQQVATAYLRAIADQSQVENANALVAQAANCNWITSTRRTRPGPWQIWMNCAARVQFESQQQALIAAQNQQAKDSILLKREIASIPDRRLR